MELSRAYERAAGRSSWSVPACTWRSLRTLGPLRKRDACGLGPGRWVVRPAAAEHRRHDLHIAQLLRLAGERVAVEHDEVGVATGYERATDALVVRQPGGRDADRMERLLERESLVVAPVVEDSRDHAGPRLELLHRRVGAVRKERAGVEERAERVGAV